MKKVIKYLLIFLICIIFGFLIGSLVGSIISGKSIAESINGLRELKIWEVIGVPLFSLLSAVVAFLILVIIHEAGHLVAGLLTGYKFISFRIFNLTFIKEDDRLNVKRFSIAGTGGQCLLSPPELPIEKIPVFWYNIGGVLANILVLLFALPFLWIADNPFATVFVAVFIAVDVILILMNGIPMNNNGIYNDAGNIGMLRKNLKAKRGLMAQLESNALIQKGVRPKDMPDSLFSSDSYEEIDYKNPLEVSIPLMRASRLIDREENEEAYEAFSELYSHKNEIMGLYVKEIACELAYITMITGRLEEAKALLDDELMKYITSYRKVMSSKERILFTKAIILDSDIAKASEILNSLSERASGYLLQGDVRGDLDLMHKIMEDQKMK